jgi:hypothetical protein
MKMTEAQANDQMKEFLKQKFEHLFGRPRLYILLDINYELFNPFCKDI